MANEIPACKNAGRGEVSCRKGSTDLKLVTKASAIGLPLAATAAAAVVSLDKAREAKSADAAFASAPETRGPATGPLRVHPENPRYFMDESGKAILLTGSHVWNNLQSIDPNRYTGGFDEGQEIPPMGTGTSDAEVDFDAYLRFLRERNHNFIRLWAWEQATWLPFTAEKVRIDPIPFLRIGPGKAVDGDLKFDLTRLNQEYFDLLRDRVGAARDEGVYVSVMLFQGWSLDSKNDLGNPWPGHPFHRDNNINGIDADRDGDDQGTELHTLGDPAITALQEAYVRKAVDTLNDMDNVLWEISNESSKTSIQWQYHMVNFIKDYESGKPHQHPVGITVCFPDGDNLSLAESPADWISPNSTEEEDYRDNPPAADGTKIIIADTDHLFGVGGDKAWVWKTFTRGLNPVFMDPLDHPPVRRQARRAMGHVLSYASRMNLAAMTPRGELVSSGFCLASPGEEYLVYVPVKVFDLGSGLILSRVEGKLTNISNRLLKRSVTVDLSEASGRFLVEWFDPSTGETTRGETVESGSSRTLKAPFLGDAVVYLQKEA